MNISTVTAKGQIVIPAKLRSKFGIKPGVKIQFFEEDGEIKILPITDEIIEKNIGILGKKGKLLSKLKAEKEREKKR